MKKQLLNIRDFVHSNISRGDKSDVLSEDLINAEKRIELIRQTCQTIEKRIASSLQTAGGGTDPSSLEKRLKKMPMMILQQCFTEFAEQLGTDTVFGQTMNECSKLQSLLSREMLNYEMEIERKCLISLNNAIESDFPIVSKSRKQLNKVTADMDSYRKGYHTVMKQIHQNPNTVLTLGTKADLLRKDLEESTTKVEQSRDSFASEMFSLLSREPEFSQIFLQYFQAQANYYKKMHEIFEINLPDLEKVIADTSQKPVFGTHLGEHLRVTEREISIVIETCIGLLLNNLNEEGLFRISGSTSKVRKLKSAFDAGIVDVDEYTRDPHTVAGVLKSYLRELPEPLLTYTLYQDWVNAAQISDADTRLQSLWKVSKKLPKVNFDNLRYLIKFLTKLSNNSEANKMSPQNLAIAIAPSLIWTPHADNAPFDMNMTAANWHSVIVDSLINYADWFFPGDVNFVCIQMSDDRFVNGETNNNSDNVNSPTISKVPALVNRNIKKSHAPPAPSVGVHSGKSSKRIDSSHEYNSGIIHNSNDNSLSHSSSHSSSSPEPPENASDSVGSAVTHSSVMMHFGSLDRNNSKSDKKRESQMSSDKTKDATVVYRNSKTIDKPNIPPPLVPHRYERPHSVFERPLMPPPERPQRSCDRVKQRSLECLNDIEDDDSKHTVESDSKLNQNLKDENTNETSNYNTEKTITNVSEPLFVIKSESPLHSIPETVPKTLIEDETDAISFADDSDDSDENGQNVKFSKMELKRPQKPPRISSNDNVTKCEDTQINAYAKQSSNIVNKEDTNDDILNSPSLSRHETRPPRPLPPANKPRVNSIEKTYL